MDGRKGCFFYWSEGRVPKAGDFGKSLKMRVGFNRRFWYNLDISHELI